MIHLKKIIPMAAFIFSANLYSAPLKHKFVEDEILVKYKSTMSSGSQKESIEKRGARRLSRVNLRGLTRVRINRHHHDVQSAIEEFKKDPNVEYAQPNYIYHASAVPNDSRYGQLWGLKNTAQKILSPGVGGNSTPSTENNPGSIGQDMKMEYAWDNITDCSSVIVGVLDTGVNYLHSDLEDNMWDGGLTYPNHGYNFVENTDDPMDTHGHGTHVAGTIGAVGNNGIGTTGVCWKVKLMAVRVLGTAGSGTSASIIAGINFAVDNGAKVLNMSLGGDVYDTAEATAMSYAESHGVLIIAAAGNDGTNNDSTAHYPCNYPNSNIVCVAALSQNYFLASFSNYGASSVDVGAPGLNIVSTWPGSNATITDALTSGWNFSSNTGVGWGYKSLNFGTATSCLVNPPTYNYSTVKYGNNLDAHAWKSFNLSSVDNAVLNFYLMIDTSVNDYLNLYTKAGAADPTTGTLQDAFNGSTSGSRLAQEYDISAYVGSSMSIGFNLNTDSSGTNFGSNISAFSIDTLTRNTTSYNVISGTSMATPHVTGLAAMIFAFNPDYTYSDVANSIKTGGVTTSSLVGKTTTGKAVSAIGSLTYIMKPTGASAVVVP